MYFQLEDGSEVHLDEADKIIFKSLLNSNTKTATEMHKYSLYSGTINVRNSV